MILQVQISSQNFRANISYPIVAPGLCILSRAIDRLLKVIKLPHPVPEVCRKAAMIIESLVSEPQNRPQLLAYENAFAEILFSDGRHSDTFARILYELTSRPNNKIAAARGIWGM